MKLRNMVPKTFSILLVILIACPGLSGCPQDDDDNGVDSGPDPSETITLTPETVTRAVLGQPEDRRFTVNASFETDHSHDQTGYWVDFTANPTGIISDAWISTSGESIHNFNYPRVSFDFTPPGTSEFTVEYECVSVGETTLTGAMSAWSLDDPPAEYSVGSDTVSITCEQGEEAACDDDDAQLGAAVTLAQLLQIQQTVFCATILQLQILYILHSSLIVGQQLVANDHTTFIYLWAASQFYTLALLNQLFNQSDFDCWDDTNGYTICPDVVNELTEGDYIIVAAIVEENIPLEDPENIYQYAFVFDSDGNPDNNYVPHPDYPNDFFSGTDLWYQANYTPTGGWSLTATDATNSTITEIPTDARIIVRDNAMFLVVPASEFGVAEPSFRITAFRHTGDWGMNPPYDWDGSVWPAVADGLEDYPTTGE